MFFRSLPEFSIVFSCDWQRRSRGLIVFQTLRVVFSDYPHSSLQAPRQTSFCAHPQCHSHVPCDWSLGKVPAYMCVAPSPCFPTQTGCTCLTIPFSVSVTVSLVNWCHIRICLEHPCTLRCFDQQHGNVWSKTSSHCTLSMQHYHA